MLSSVVDLTITKEHIAIITLNRPKAANALSTEVLSRLEKVISTIDLNTSVYCTIIRGTSKSAFCAGADLKERVRMTDEQTIASVRLIGHITLKIEQMQMPTIAVLNGATFGGGLELALACDLRIAADHALMGLTETALAIIPGAGGTQRLSRLIGLGQAKRLIYSASKITAMEAFQIGLVQEVVKSDVLHEHAIKIAKSIAKNGPIALKLAKSALNKGYQTDLTTALEIEHLHYLQTIPTQDRKEGLNAFIEKRNPQYKGK